MIDATLLRQLGWSKELIDSVTRVAEPMRENPASDIEMMYLMEDTVSGSAVYAGSAVLNSGRGYRIYASRLMPPRSAAKPKARKARISRKRLRRRAL